MIICYLLISRLYNTFIVRKVLKTRHLAALRLCIGTGSITYSFNLQATKDVVKLILGLVA